MNEHRFFNGYFSGGHLLDHQTLRAFFDDYYDCFFTGDGNVQYQF